MPEDEPFRSGFVAIIGAPNSGKSTLLNALLGQKIAITSAKPQTTRSRVLGVLTRPQAQIIFLDTPGIHQPKSLLHRSMVETALAALAEVDVVLWLIDASRRRPEDEDLVLSHLKRVERPVVVGLNKIDRIKKPLLLPLIQDLAGLGDFQALVPISALKGDGLEVLTEELLRRLPQGPALFPADEVTDQPERVLVAEMVREKAIRLTGQEVPYGLAVSVTEFSERPAKEMIYIRAVIYVEKESHKGIIIGAGGAKLKQIGQSARRDIEALLGVKVYLDLFVQTARGWTRQEGLVRKLGH